MYTLTQFDTIYDKDTTKVHTYQNLEDFEKVFYNLSKRPGYKPKKGEFKAGSPLITPATFSTKEGRKNVNVVQWNRWAALDVDDYNSTFEESLMTFKDYYFICYSSASSSKKKPKYRIVLPLTDNVSADKIRHFWFALNTEFNSLGDKQTKDLCRIYYVPAKYPGANNFIFTNKKNRHINPHELMNKHEFIEPTSSGFPPEIEEALLKYRKERLQNTNYAWSGWRDCPFVNQQMVREYFSITETGWYRQMYRIISSIAGNAVRRGYPITAEMIETLCREIDQETGLHYKNRPIRAEAERAISYVLKNQ